MKLTNTFVQSKMNKDIDERLVPKGQYPHAENLRVAQSDGSDVGALENVKGNERLTDLGLTNAKTIGAYTDGANQKIYWFVTSNEKDLVMEYNFLTRQQSVLLESSNPDGVLNFNKDYLITGVVKIINGDSRRDLLVWTDDLNPIRKINIERAKTYLPDGFIEDDISLAKKPPIHAPTTVFTYLGDTSENSIENKFLSFSYRYKYLDGEYSALSSYTNYKFSPEEFSLDFQTMENEGMVNAFNAVRVGFNTGDARVTDIQLIVKESNSNALALVETFNKSDEGWGNNETRSFVFSNSKKYTYLPEKELFRAYDAVPRTAKALELVNNRLIFGNYTEGFDMINKFGEPVVVDYDLSLLNKDLTGVSIPVFFNTTTVASDTLTIDLIGKQLNNNTRIALSLFLNEPTYNGLYDKIFSYILNDDFEDATALANSEDFSFFVTDVMTNDFLANYDAIPPANSTVLSTTGFEIVGSTATQISIKAPTITYRIDNTPLNTSDSDFTDVTANWKYTTNSSAFYREIAVNTSLKTNRSYEVGIIYLDEFNRASTVSTCKDNTIRVSQKFSTFQNVIVANINHTPPVGAVRYKMVVKQNKSTYQTIYTNTFYEDGLFRWVKLEGANKDKVKEGDTLIVKSDLGGVVSDLIRVRVLEVTLQPSDFIKENKNADGDDLIEEAGLYMKIKPSGFDMNFNDSTARTFEGSSHMRYPTNCYTSPSFGTGSVAGADFQPYTLSAGSTVRIFIEFSAKGSIEYKATYDKNFRVNADYASIQDWFDAEVVDLGSFGDDFTRDYGFTPQGEQFFARAHRDGTASRSISSTVRFEVLFSEGIVIFETEPEDDDNNVFYETEQTFEIVDGYHQGNIQDQSETEPTAVVELDFFNCYVQGNGAESYRYKDTFNGSYLNIDLRPSSTSVESFRFVRRFADLTYSEPYNENTNINGLNEFNLSTLNFKEDIDKKYGFIQKLFAKDTDLVVFQEDKVSRVLFGKDMLLNADGTSNLASVLEILGRQIMYTGEYGISRNPESFAFDANNIYFTDAKRGCVCRLAENGITEISMAGMINFFKEEFRGGLYKRKYGAYDPFYDQYVLHNEDVTTTLTYNITCSQNVQNNDFIGQAIINIDYDILIGTASFSYSSNGVPVRYVLVYDGVTYDTGYVGDPSYNDELNDLGLPNVVGSGTGTLSFTKDKSIPRLAQVTVYAPLEGTDYRVDGVCIVPPIINVVSIVLSDERDLGLTMKSRYKWNNETYNSQFKSYDSIFNETGIALFSSETGASGTIGVPLVDSTVELQSYKGISQTAVFKDLNQLGYLVSNTPYNVSDIDTILGLATFPTVTETISPNGDITNKTSFVYSRPSSEQYLYLIWNYRDPAPVDCVVSDWSDWSECVEGTQTRTRTIITSPEHGGMACPVLTETRSCSSGYCAVWDAENQGNIRMSLDGYIDFTEALAGRTINTGASSGSVESYVIDGNTVSGIVNMTFTSTRAVFSTNTFPAVTNKVLTGITFFVEVTCTDGSTISVPDTTLFAMETPDQTHSSYDTCSI